MCYFNRTSGATTATVSLLVYNALKLFYCTIKSFIIHVHTKRALSLTVNSTNYKKKEFVVSV